MQNIKLNSYFGKTKGNAPTIRRAMVFAPQNKKKGLDAVYWRKKTVAATFQPLDQRPLNEKLKDIDRPPMFDLAAREKSLILPIFSIQKQTGK